MIFVDKKQQHLFVYLFSCLQIRKFKTSCFAAGVGLWDTFLYNLLQDFVSLSLLSSWNLSFDKDGWESTRTQNSDL